MISLLLEHLHWGLVESREGKRIPQIVLYKHIASMARACFPSSGVTNSVIDLYFRLLHSGSNTLLALLTFSIGFLPAYILGDLGIAIFRSLA